MAAKEKWLSGNVAEARAILLEAFRVNPKVRGVGIFMLKCDKWM